MPVCSVAIGWNRVGSDEEVFDPGVAMKAVQP